MILYLPPGFKDTDWLLHHYDSKGGFVTSNSQSEYSIQLIGLCQAHGPTPIPGRDNLIGACKVRCSSLGQSTMVRKFCSLNKKARMAKGSFLWLLGMGNVSVEEILF